MAFDLNTHIRNKKGQVVQENHYTLVIENGVKKYKRGDKFFSEDGQELVNAQPNVQPVAVAPAKEVAVDDLLPKAYAKK